MAIYFYFIYIVRNKIQYLLNSFFIMLVFYNTLFLF